MTVSVKPRGNAYFVPQQEGQPSPIDNPFPQSFLPPTQYATRSDKIGVPRNCHAEDARGVRRASSAVAQLSGWRAPRRARRGELPQHASIRVKCSSTKSGEMCRKRRAAVAHGCASGVSPYPLSRLLFPNSVRHGRPACSRQVIHLPPALSIHLLLLWRSMQGWKRKAPPADYGRPSLPPLHEPDRRWAWLTLLRPCALDRRGRHAVSLCFVSF